MQVEVYQYKLAKARQGSNLTPEQQHEIQLCAGSPDYFIDAYCQIQDSVARGWIPFHLWPAQRNMIQIVHDHQRSVHLKPRQVGATWVMLGYALWQMLFEPIAYVLIFNRREDEAIMLLDDRLKGMYKRLPQWMRDALKTEPIETDAKKHWELANGSQARAFSAKGGDSHTATLAIMDEADLAPDFDVILASVEPTINAGGKLVLLSRANKQKPSSTFKDIYKGAELGENGYAPHFIAWHAHPDRDQAWYEATKKAYISMPDEFLGQYPATAEEALALGYQGRVFPNWVTLENVQEEAEYNPTYPVIWSVDPGYTNPTAILLIQERPFMGIPDHWCVFHEVYVTQHLERDALKLAFQLGYPSPDVFIYDTESPQIAVEMQRFRTYGIPELNIQPFMCQIVGADKRPGSVAEGIKVVRRYIGEDSNGRRLLRVHPRCKHLIEEIPNYVYAESTRTKGGDPVPEAGQADHACDALRYSFVSKMYKAID